MGTVFSGFLVPPDGKSRKSPSPLPDGKKMKITYIGHSSFSVETEKSIFIFDYFKGELPGIPADK